MRTFDLGTRCEATFIDVRARTGRKIDTLDEGVL